MKRRTLTAAMKTTNVGSPTLVGIFCVLVLALLPSPVAAQCAQWDASGKWEIQQSNGYSISMDLRQNGKAITGTAQYFKLTGGTKVLGVLVQGGDAVNRSENVFGNLEGDDFYMTMGAGVYRGKVGPSGRIDGTTYDRSNPSSKANWFSTASMKCADAAPIKPIKSTGRAPAPAPPAAPDRGPIKHSGHVASRDPNSPVHKRLEELGAFGSPKPQSAQGAPMITASPRTVRIPEGESEGTTTLTWEGGSEHPYAEVWVKEGDEDEKFVVEKGKGSRQVKVEAGKTYLYILTDSGKRLSTVTVTTK